MLVFLTIIAAPSGFYAKAKMDSPAPANTTATNIRVGSSNSDGGHSSRQQYCDLFVPSITGTDSPELQDQANITYRWVANITCSVE